MLQASRNRSGMWMFNQFTCSVWYVPMRLTQNMQSTYPSLCRLSLPDIGPSERKVSTGSPSCARGASSWSYSFSTCEHPCFEQRRSQVTPPNQLEMIFSKLSLGLHSEASSLGPHLHGEILSIISLICYSTVPGLIITNLQTCNSFEFFLVVAPMRS